MFKKLSKAGRHLSQTARLMVGIPDYENYVEHMRQHHPDQHCMAYKEFIQNRQEARYNGKGPGKCC